MLFKILKLFGLDVPAKVDAAKALIEERAAEVADRAKHTALSAALIVALSTFAGLFFTVAIGVGLLALYHTEEAAFGMNVALGIVAAVLVAATLILLTIALMLGKIVVRQARARPSERRRDTSRRSRYATGKGPIARSARK